MSRPDAGSSAPSTYLWSRMILIFSVPGSGREYFRLSLNIRLQKLSRMYFPSKIFFSSSRQIDCEMISIYTALVFL